MKLSFSTMRLLHECPHCYVNKISGIKQPESIYLTEGKIAHGIAQRHVSGVEAHPALEHIALTFAVVEKRDFDPDCKFLVPVGQDLALLNVEDFCTCDFPNEKDGQCRKCGKEIPPYVILGFIDGLDKKVSDEPTVMLECKFSGSPWSLGKYKKDPQRKIYGWAMRTVKTAYLITGKRKPEEWETIKPVTRKVDFTEQDYKDAEEWMAEAIRRIENKEFYSDLVNGKCVDPRCYWGERCMFK